MSKSILSGALKLAALAFLAASPAAAQSTQQATQQPTFVRAKAANTMGCTDPENVRALRDVLETWDIQPPVGWERNLAEVGCYPVAADLRWRVARRLGDVVALQLAEEAITRGASVLLFFSVADLVTMDGQPYRPRR